MGDPRRIALVIGSQCEQLEQLSFLPASRGPVDLRALEPEQRVLLELHELLIDGPGDCVPAPGIEGVSAPGLLLNPTAAQASAGLRAAVGAASDAGAVLIVHILAHGAGAQGDPAHDVRHLLHAWDTVAEPYDTEPESRGWDPYRDIGSRIRHETGITGVVLSVDACHASWSVSEVGRWSGVRGGLLSAVLLASGDHEAWDACLTAVLIQTLRDGLTRQVHPRGVLVSELLAGDLEPVAAARCTHQTPRLGGYQSHNPALFLARNRGAELFASQLGVDAATAEVMLRLTRYYVDDAAATIAEQLDGHRFVTIVGKAGSGKSTVAAALRRAPAGSRAPLGVVQAVALASASVGAGDLARSLAGQLQGLPGFAQASERFEAENQERWSSLDEWQRTVIGPLGEFSQPVRVLIDGVDQLEGTVHEHAVWRSIRDLLDDTEHVSVVLTSRREPPIGGSTSITMPELDDEAARRFLTAREVDPVLHDNLIAIVDGRWLLLDLAAETPALAADGSLENLYDALIEQLTGARGELANTVLALLAAAGTGPVLPLDVLLEATNRLLACERDELLALLGEDSFYHLIDRAAPGTTRDHVGLFHQTLTARVTRQDDDPARAHLAIAEALETLADNHNPKDYRDDPITTYAFEAQADHWAAAGHPEMIVTTLSTREDVSPAVNLARFAEYEPLIRAELAADHPDTLMARSQIAYWTGQSGDAGAALELFVALLPDEERVLGADHPNTLTDRGNIASWTGELGDARAALELFVALLADQERVLGADHPNTLSTRNNIAAWTGQSGDARGALELYVALLSDQERVLGADHPDTLITRNNIAASTGQSGNARAALELFVALLPDQERVLGADHPNTLITRGNIAYWTGQLGDARAALELFVALLPDEERVLGADHPNTLTDRGDIASWTGELGDARAALELFVALLADQERVLGADHPNTLSTRGNIAAWTGQSGDARGALELYVALLSDQERVLGADHPDTLITRGNIAAWTGQSGNARGALELFVALLPDQERVLGADDPNTLITRGNIAYWTGKLGDARAALELYVALLPDRERVLGADHPNTLTDRGDIASWTGQSGDARGALELFVALLPDQERVLGADHPNTLSTRGNIAYWTGQSGDARAALELFVALLSDQERVLGADHPNTLSTRGNIAYWTGELGDARGALELSVALLPDQERVLGADHPNTLAIRNSIRVLSE
jgi:Tetratricopeptide repeat